MNPLPRRPERRVLSCAAIAGVLLGAVAAGPTAGADPAESLQSIERKLDEARKREQELDREASDAEAKLARLRQRSIAIAAGIQEHEATIIGLENRLSTLEDLRRSKVASLQDRRAQLAGMLAALQRIAMHPPIALIALPTAPVDTVRSALLLRNTVPAVRQLGHTLREDIDALAEIAQAVRAARSKMEAERGKLLEQRAVLARLTTEKAEAARSARRALHDLQQEAERLGKEAHDLRDLVARLAKRSAAKRKTARLTPDLPTPGRRSVLPSLAPDGLPVRGRIARSFGEYNEFGQHSRGVVINAISESTVVAPRDGEVVFAGPFRGLGNLLIIEYQAKYHLLLGGLARIDTQVGEQVLAGEPVGVMQSAEDQETSSLYMELRRNGQPINPMPWLAAGRTKVNG